MASRTVVLKVIFIWFSLVGNVYARRKWVSAASGRGKTGNVESEFAKTQKLCDPDVEQIHGYFKIDGSVNKNYFFWFFESRDSPSTSPVIVWLTGGPGCSSMLALFAENGPCTVNDDGTSTKVNPYSWTSHANVLWIDQPAGTGFSYGDADDYDHNEQEVSDDLYHFLKDFFTTYSQYANLDLFIFGESYGGHYVPAVSFQIFTENQKDSSPLRLKGLGIGNGLTDPMIQFQYYAQMAMNNTYGIKILNDDDYNYMMHTNYKCIDLIKECQGTTSTCDDAQYYCTAVTMGFFRKSGLNIYDIRSECGVSNNLCYDFSPINKFLNLNSTRQALGIRNESKEWKECNFLINDDFMFDWMKNFQNKLVPLLESGIKVLVYAGDADYICNWMGNKAWALALKWNGKSRFNSAKDKPWVVDGQEAGIVRSSGALTFVQVFDAGHMVPMDQPKVALSLLTTYLQQSSFA